MKSIRSHKELEVYILAFDLASRIYRVNQKFQKEELYSLTDQIRRSSRSVTANLAEAFRKRRYPKSFVAKLNDCEAEAAETQVWFEYALQWDYISEETFNFFFAEYERVIGKLVTMANNPDKWKF